LIHPTEQISAYLDGELHGPELTQLMDHLSRCGKCTAELEQMQIVRSAVRSLPVLELPEGLVSEADRVVVPLPRRKGMWAGVAAAAVVAAIALAAIVTPPQDEVSLQQLNSMVGARSTLDPVFGPAKVSAFPLVGE
jgi:anti-sigma factor RsiW